MPLKQSIYFSERKKVLVGDSIKLFIKNKEIDKIGAGCINESFKLVGIHLDENLTWSNHLKAVKMNPLSLWEYILMKT